MKKRGSSILAVLLIIASLLILGTAIASTVVQTVKLNKNYSDIVDLELAAKSSINIVVDNFKANVGKKYQVNDYFVSEKYSNIINDINNIYDVESGIEIKLSYSMSDDVLIIKAKARDRDKDIIREEKRRIVFDENSEIEEDNDGNIGGNIIKPVNFINAIQNVSLGDSNLECLNYIAYGGNLTSNNYDFNQPTYIKPTPSEELKNKNMQFNEENFNALLREWDRENYDPFIPENNYLEIKGSDVQENTFNDLKDENVIVDGDVFLNSSRLTWKVDNSVLIIDGNLKSSNEVKIEIINNGKLIINGDINITNLLNIKVDDESLIEVNGEIYLSGTCNIEINNSKFFVKESFISGTSFYINIYNSILDVLGKFDSPGGISGEINSNSRFDVGNNFNSGSSINLNINNNSIINIYGNITCPAVISAEVKNNSKFVVRGSLSTSSTGYNFTLSNNSILIASNLTAPGGSKFILNKSVIIADKIKSNSIITINLDESNFIIKNNFDVNGLIANLNNSTIISINLFKALYNSIITNLGKSYILSGRDFITSGITISGGEKSITPDSDVVIDSIKYFIVQ